MTEPPDAGPGTAPAGPAVEPGGTDPVPAPPASPEIEPTGHEGVDTALASLEGAAGLPAGSRLPVYEDVHRRLRDILAALDDPPGPPPAAVRGQDRS